MATGDKLVTLDELKLVNDRVKPVTEGGTGATTAAGARANLGITPDNIGAVAIYSDQTCLFTGQEIPANGTMDISFATNISNFFMLVMGMNYYAHDYYEGFNGAYEICIPVAIAINSVNRYSSLTAPNASWKAWFPSHTVLHVENNTSNILTFRLNGFK